MKKIIVLLSLFTLFLTACSPVIRYVVPATEPQVDKTEISGPSAPTTVVSPLPMDTQSTLTPIPPALATFTTSQRQYLSSLLGFQISYPGNWYRQETPDSPDIWGQPEAQAPGISLTSFDPANPPHKLEWTDQTISVQFRLLPAGSVPQSLDTWVESATQAAVAAGLSLFEEERLLVAGQPAVRLNFVSGSGGIIHQILTILDGRYYEISIQGNLDLGKSALSTLSPLSTGGLKPAEGDTPAAGICGNPLVEVVAIELGADPSGLPLAGRCIVLLPTQRIKLINHSDEHIATQFADYQIDLPVGAEIILDNPVGEYLAPGVHYLQMAPALWLKPAGAAVTPLATIPSALSTYSNLDVGYTLTIPPGWNVDEYGLTMPGKEVIFYPNNPEPSLAYLSISLDPRTIDEIKNLYAQSVPDATREDTIFNGLPAVKYTYPYGRHEYYVPYEDRILLITTDKPADGDVQTMIESFQFVDTSR